MKAQWELRDSPLRRLWTAQWGHFLIRTILSSPACIVVVLLGNSVSGVRNVQHKYSRYSSCRTHSYYYTYMIPHMYIKRRHHCSVHITQIGSLLFGCFRVGVFKRSRSRTPVGVVWFPSPCQIKVTQNGRCRVCRVNRSDLCSEPLTRPWLPRRRLYTTRLALNIRRRGGSTSSPRGIDPKTSPQTGRHSELQRRSTRRDSPRPTYLVSWTSL